MKEDYPVPAEFEKTARTNEQEYFERYPLRNLLTFH